MNQLRINRNFDRMSDAELQVKTNQIIADLSENFATAPGLTTLMAAREAFTAALASAMAGGTIERAVKNQKKDELVFEHSQMISYVLLTAAGDRTKAAQSGYSLAKASSTPRELTQPGNLKVVNGANAGELELVFDKVQAAYSYIYQCTQEPLSEASEWQQYYGSRRKYLFTGLETGKRYWVRVAAVGKGVEVIFSEPVLSKLVQ